MRGIVGGSVCELYGAPHVVFQSVEGREGCKVRGLGGWVCIYCECVYFVKEGLARPSSGVQLEVQAAGGVIVEILRYVLPCKSH
jgi:hypothetical protein